MNKLVTAMALVLVSTSLAQAAWSKADFIKSYDAQGYSGVEVRMMGNQAKVQAVKDGTRVEVFHDIETGAVLARDISGRRVADDGGRHSHDDDHGRHGDDDDHGRHGGDDDHGRHGEDDDHDDDHGRHGPGHD